MKIRVSILINQGRKIHDIINHLEFENTDDFVDYKHDFYDNLFDRGWRRNGMSANQCYKGNLTLTPYFIRE